MNIPYGRQDIHEEDIQAVVSVLKSDFLTQGPQVEIFEKKIAEGCHAKHVVAVNNGTSALHLAAMALNVKPGDWVLVASNTFAASANCIRYCGGDVEFVDIDPSSYCIDVNDVERRLKNGKRNYKGIVVVDFAGYPVDMKKLRQLADTNGLWILEDACHAIGAYYLEGGQKQYCGGSGAADITAFSFHPVKHIATGEGGALSTSRTDLYEKMKVLRTHGIERKTELYTHKQERDGAWYHEMQFLGHNFRISDILCVLGSSQMNRLPQNLEVRQKIASAYNKELAGLPITLPHVPKDFYHAYHLYVIRTQKRLELFNYLKDKGIHCQIHYIPVYRHPYYQELYGQVTDCPKSLSYYDECLSLPMYHSLTPDLQAYVIDCIKQFFNS